MFVIKLIEKNILTEKIHTYNGSSLETIGSESISDLIREINRGKQGHKTGLNNL